MLYVHPSLAKRTSDLQRADQQRRAERWRLLVGAGLVQQHCLPEAGRRLLCRLRQGLVIAGEWLERRAALERSPQGQAALQVDR